MDPKSSYSPQQSDLKFIYSLSKVWVSYIARRWYFIVAFALLGFAYGYYKTKDYQTTYTGKVTFVLSSESGNNSGFGGLAAQLGIGSTTSSGGVFSGENILQFFQSKKVFKKALFRKIPEKNESLFNYCVKAFGLNGGWNSNYLKNTFPFPDSAEQMTPIQDSIFSQVQGFILGMPGYFVPIKPDKKLVFYEVSSTTPNEIFSAYLPKFIVEETANFYIETKTQRARESVKMMQHEVDSLGGTLNKTIITSAQSTAIPFSINPAIALQRAPTQKAQINIGTMKSTAVSAAYGQMLTSLQSAKIQLQNDIPLFQIIDLSPLPLTMVTRDKSRLIFLYIVAGIFAGLGLLILYKIKFPNGIGYQHRKKIASVSDV